MIDVYPPMFGFCRIKSKTVSLTVDLSMQDFNKLPKDVNDSDFILSSGIAKKYQINNASIVIAGQGEYEIKGVAIVATRNYSSTFYRFNLDNVNFLVILENDKYVDEKLSENFEDIDVLITTTNISKIIFKINPKIAILIDRSKLKDEEYEKKLNLAIQRINTKLTFSKEKLPEHTVVYLFSNQQN